MSIPTLLVIAGVSGSGKTTIGLELAQRLNVPFLDGDDLHPESNIELMNSGIPLKDSDREPWLLKIREKGIDLLNDSTLLNTQSGKIGKYQAVVIACSALKRKYRDILRGTTFENNANHLLNHGIVSNVMVHFLYLKAQPELLKQRLNDRKNHFMGVDMLPSQLATLEEPDPHEEDNSQSKIITLTLDGENGEPKESKQIVDEAIHQLVTKTQAPITTASASGELACGLPNLKSLFETESEKLQEVLGLLFEVSNSIEKKLIPALKRVTQLKPPSSYDELITYCQDLIQNEFSLEEKTDFLGSHPRIGEVKNLSKLSSKEQGNVTDPKILARLEQLNALYEELYTGLRYVTFVNGRTRGEIVKEMEELLLRGGVPVNQAHHQDEAWRDELERGISDVFKIARSRLKSFN